MDYYTVEASLGLGDLSLDQSGDFQVNLLGKIMNSPELRSLTIKAWLSKVPDQKTIIFCASLKHAEDLAEDFNQLGIPAAYVSGQSADRDDIIWAFRKGDIQVLTNFGVLTEGFDDPSIECVLLARPTTSPLVYSQCLGRGLRTFPGKKSCTVIDIVDRQQHQLQYNAYEAAGLHRSWRGSGRDPLREAEAIARIRVTDPGAFLKIKNALSLDETHQILMDLDPRTVLAGIDGMPLVRYQALPSGSRLDGDQALAIAGRILEEAGLQPQAWDMGQDSVKARLYEQDRTKLTPYLSWHVNRATGRSLAATFEIPPLPKPVPVPLVPLMEKLAAILPVQENVPVVPPKAPTKIQGGLSLKSRLEKIIHEGQKAAIPIAAKETPMTPATPKGSSIQDRLKAMKSHP